MMAGDAPALQGILDEPREIVWQLSRPFVFVLDLELGRMQGVTWQK
jgi:hypothetical protein